MPAGNAQDLTGMKFGSYTVLERAPDRVSASGRRSTMWRCQCVCGAIKDVYAGHLKSRPNISCGCQKRTTLEDLTGQTFGFYKVLERAPSRDKGDGKKRTMWRCQCVCGAIKEVAASQLKSRPNISCGCKKGEVLSAIKCDDLTGKKFGRLSVTGRAPDYVRPNGHADTQWFCKCDCGNEVIKRSIYLKQSPCPSCGCWKSEITSETMSNDLTGLRFGMLTVMSFSHIRRTKGGNNPVRMYNCICDCGNEKLVSSNSLINGSTQSCGCHKFSSGERTVDTVLSAFNLSYTTEYTFKDLRLKNPLRFDFAVFNGDGSLACLIEFQGQQHYMQTGTGKYDFGKQQREVTDSMKKEYCKQNNIVLCEIPYNADIETEVIRIIATHVNPVPSVA